MKLAHRRVHIFAWIILGPVIFLTLLAAVMHRPAEPVNEALPDAITGEAP